jgi:hypothetical protein
MGLAELNQGITQNYFSIAHRKKGVNRNNIHKYQVRIYYFGLGSDRLAQAEIHICSARNGIESKVILY